MSLLLYLIHTVIELAFSFFIILLLLRFLLQAVKASFLHPIIQLLVKVTNPILLPIRRITPILGRLDWACIVAVMLLGLAKYLLMILIGLMPPRPPTIIFGLLLFDLLRYVAYIYLFALIVRAIGSWIGSTPRQSALLALLELLTNPLLKRIPFHLQWKQIDFKPMLLSLLLLIVVQFSTAMQRALIIYGQLSTPETELQREPRKEVKESQEREQSEHFRERSY